MHRGDLVALTGGSGFVGSHVADALLAAGYRVRALARRPDEPRLAERHGRRAREGRRARRRDAAVARRGRVRRRPRGGKDIRAERGRIHGRERGGFGERRRGRAEVGAGRAPRPRVFAGGGRPEPERSSRAALPTRRARSPRTAARSSRARRRSGTNRVSPSRSSAPAPCTGLARRRSGTCSSRPRADSCPSWPVERRASSWSTPATRRGPSSAPSGGEGRARRSSSRTRRFSSTATSPRRSRPFPRGGHGSCRSPRRRSGRRVLATGVLSAFGKGPPGLQRGEGERAAPERVDLRRLRRASRAGSAISDRF